MDTDNLEVLKQATVIGSGLSSIEPKLKNIGLVVAAADEIPVALLEAAEAQLVALTATLSALHSIAFGRLAPDAVAAAQEAGL